MSFSGSIFLAYDELPARAKTIAHFLESCGFTVVAGDKDFLKQVCSDYEKEKSAGTSPFPYDLLLILQCDKEFCVPPEVKSSERQLWPEMRISFPANILINKLDAWQLQHVAEIVNISRSLQDSWPHLFGAEKLHSLLDDDIALNHKSPRVLYLKKDDAHLTPDHINKLGKEGCLITTFLIEDDIAALNRNLSDALESKNNYEIIVIDSPSEAKEKSVSRFIRSSRQLRRRSLPIAYVEKPARRCLLHPTRELYLSPLPDAHSFHIALGGQFNSDIIATQIMSIASTQMIKDLGLRSAKEMKRAANCDSLTGLFNRYALHTTLKKLSQQNQSDANGIGILSMDLNWLKTVNDTLGHPNGDLVLIAFADALTELFRKDSERKDLVVRLGGDEFLIILTGINQDQIKPATNRILKDLPPLFQDNLFQLKSMEPAALELIENLSFSVGVDYLSYGALQTSLLDDDPKTAIGNLTKQADQALYEAKKNKVMGTTAFFASDLKEQDSHAEPLRRHTATASGKLDTSVSTRPQQIFGHDRSATIESDHFNP